MNIQDFKQELLNKTLNEDLIIFVCSENTFLAETYIDEICAQKNLSKNYINELAETTNSALALIMDYTDDLNILKTDTFAEKAEYYGNYKNCVVVCKKVDKSIQEDVKDFIIEIPKIIDWQAKAYIMSKCPGLSEADADWLYTSANANIFKIDNELNKLCLLEESERSASLKQTCSDLFVQKVVFELVDALVKNDKVTISDVLRHADDYTNLDPIGLTTLTLTKFKNVALVCYKSNVNEAELGLSRGALWYLKNNNKNIPLARIEKAINFLSNIDSRLKSNPSSLDFVGNRKNALLEYIIIGTLTCAN